MLSRLLRIALLAVWVVLLGCGGALPENKEPVGVLTLSLTLPKKPFFMFPVGAEGQKIGYYVAQRFNNSSAEGYCSDGSSSTIETCKARWRFGHSGLDLNGNNGGATDCGDPVYAAGDGIVAEAGPKSGWGNIIRIRHSTPDGYRYTLYGHLQSIGVKIDQQVVIGQKIGAIGNGGVSTACHLHFGVLIIDEAAQGYYYGTPPSTLLDPQQFVSNALPFKLNLSTGNNPYTCDSEPVVSGNAYACNKKTEFITGSAAHIYGLLQVDSIGLNLCLQVQYFKDGTEQKQLQAEYCSAWDQSTTIEKGYFWNWIPGTSSPGSWQIQYRIRLNNLTTEYPKVATATAKFTIKPASAGSGGTTAPMPPAINPPAPPPPLYQTAYVYAGVNLTGSQPFLSNTTTGGYDYIPSALQSTFTYGQSVFGIVKLHYLTANIRFRFRYELYRNGGLVSVTEEATWKATGNYGLVQAYGLPTASPAVLGKFPDVGTWTLRTFIIIDGRFTNWVADQRVVVF